MPRYRVVLTPLTVCTKRLFLLPDGTAVLAVPGLPVAGGIGDDHFSFPLRRTELGCWFCIYNRDDIPGTIATGAAITGISRTRSFLHEHTMEFPRDLINVMKLPYRENLFLFIPGPWFTKVR
jgi:hypothetical protein